MPQINQSLVVNFIQTSNRSKDSTEYQLTSNIQDISCLIQLAWKNLAVETRVATLLG